MEHESITFQRIKERWNQVDSEILEQFKYGDMMQNRFSILEQRFFAMMGVVSTMLSKACEEEARQTQRKSSNGFEKCNIGWTNEKIEVK